jgi:predicted RNA-binding protein with PUA-like domain
MSKRKSVVISNESSNNSIQGKRTRREVITNDTELPVSQAGQPKSDELVTSSSAMSYVKYLIKSEPDDYSIDDITKSSGEIGRYDGVRNYQARNHIRTMQPGDLIFFYHSNIKKDTGIYGIVEVVGPIYLDPTAMDSSHRLYDPSCDNVTDIQKMKWLAFNMKIVERWTEPVLLSTLKTMNGTDSPLANMMLFKNSRLSVQLVTPAESDAIRNIKKNRSSIS